MIALSLSSTFLSVIMTSISSNATEDERYVFPIFDESTNKILKDELGIKNTCRISLYFYNTKEEIDNGKWNN